MARLAIRATGDKSAREVVATGERMVRVEFRIGNKLVRTYTLDTYEAGKPRIVEHSENGTHVCTTHIHSETHSA
jgi:hypothetical protein